MHLDIKQVWIYAALIVVVVAFFCVWLCQVSGA